MEMRSGKACISGLKTAVWSGSTPAKWVMRQLGINASNEAYMQLHGLGEFERELYPLSEFDLSEVEISEPELEVQEPSLME